MDAEVVVVVEVIPDRHRSELTVLKQKLVFRGGRLAEVGRPWPARVRLRKKGPEARDLDARLSTTLGLEGTMLTVTLENKGTAPVEVDEVLFEYEAEPAGIEIGEALFEDNDDLPQPVGSTSLLALEEGTTMSFDAEHGAAGALAPGERRQLFINPALMDALKCVVAALPPERYWVSIRSRGNEVLHIDGREIEELTLTLS